MESNPTEDLETTPSLFGVRQGVICQQVNCQNVMGAGLARAIMEKYPEVAEKYHQTFEKYAKESLFGRVYLVKLSEGLYVANIYSQFYYGNPAKTGKVYTDAKKLVTAVNGICKQMKDFPVYLPHSIEREDDGIGCGYGGETWEKLSRLFSALGHENLHLLDTNTGIIHELRGEREALSQSESCKTEEFPYKNFIPGFSFMDSTPHVKQKYPPCRGISPVGKVVEQFQADIASEFGYKPLPPEIQSKAVDIYLANLPAEFVPDNIPGGAKVKGGSQIPGKRQPLFLKDGTKLADGYDRIVVGHYGAFIEIDESDIVPGVLKTQKGEEYREKGRYQDNVKYFWKTVRDTGVKIYEQKREVSYADYRVGKYYISPYEVMEKDEVLAAGHFWNDAFTEFASAEKPKQESLTVDPSLYEGRPVVLSFATTGLSPSSDEILQIAVVDEDGQILLTAYTGTEKNTSWKEAEAVHHITPEMVEGKPSAAGYADAMEELLTKASVIVCHNVPFDLGFLKSCFGFDLNALTPKLFDTLTRFQEDYPDKDHYKLTDAMEEYCPEKAAFYRDHAHNALADAFAVAAVYRTQQKLEREQNRVSL